VVKLGVAPEFDVLEIKHFLAFWATWQHGPALVVSFQVFEDDRIWLLLFPFLRLCIQSFVLSIDAFIEIGEI
jgi:hypothetical protein